MTGRWWESDDRLLAALDDALRAGEEVPASFGATGRAVYPSPDLDAELAALTYDSAAPSLALVRADRAEEPASLRALTYAGTRLTVHLEVSDGAVYGQVAPAQRCEVELQTGRGAPRVVRTDMDGWFVVRPAPTGRFRLHCRTATNGPGMVTGWIAV
jgi:hypothetical protein